MRLKRFLNVLREAVVYRKVNPDTRQRWTINRNPTQRELLGLMSRATTRRLRGWVERMGEHAFYVWDAEQATHDEVSQYLVPMDSGWPIEIERAQTGLTVEIWDEPDQVRPISVEIKSNPNFARAIPQARWIAMRNLGDKVLIEAVEDIRGTRTYVNPSLRQALALLERSHHKALRGVVAQGNVYVWDAFDDAHANMYGKITGSATDAGEHTWASFVLAHADTTETELRRDWFGTEHTYEVAPAVYLCPNDEAFDNPLIQSWLRKATTVYEGLTEQIIVNEKVEDLNGIGVFVDPGLDVVRRFGKTYQNLRGLWDGQHTYLWNAMDGMHYDIEGALGINYFENTFVLLHDQALPDHDLDTNWTEDITPTCVPGYQIAINRNALASPLVKRLLGQRLNPD